MDVLARGKGGVLMETVPTEAKKHNFFTYSYSMFSQPPRIYSQPRQMHCKKKLTEKFDTLDGCRRLNYAGVECFVY